jgi:hypothetical protein
MSKKYKNKLSLQKNYKKNTFLEVPFSLKRIPILSDFGVAGKIPDLLMGIARRCDLRELYLLVKQAYDN